MAESRTIDLDDMILQECRVDVHLRLKNESAYLLEENIRRYCGGRITSEGSQVFEAMVSCFSIQDALKRKLNGDFREDRSKLFSSMYALFVGANEALDVLGDDDRQIMLRHRRSSLDSFCLDRDRTYIGWQHQTISLFVELLRENAGEAHIGALARDYFSYLIDMAREVMEEGQFQDSLEQARKNTVSYEGKTVRGLVSKSPDLVRNASLTWDSIIGYDDIKRKFQRWQLGIQNLDSGLKFTDNKLDICPNIVLYGRPGTGKTLMARVFANETGMPMVSVDLEQLASSYKDRSNKRFVKKIKEAIGYIQDGGHEFAMLFLDEMQYVCRARFQKKDDDEGDKLPDTLINYTDDNKQVPGLIVVGTINNIKVMSDALERRLPEKIEFYAPDSETLASMIRYYAEKNNRKAELEYIRNVDADIVAKHCVHADGRGFVGADISLMFKSLIPKTIARYVNGKEYIVGTEQLVEAALERAKSAHIEDKKCYT